MSARTALHLAAMVVLGAVCFAAFGWAVQWREGREIAPPPGTDLVTAGQDPTLVLVRGLGAAAGAADRHLANGERGDAMAALDATWRLADVGRTGTYDQRRWAFAETYLQAVEARLAVQRGDPAGARRLLRHLRATAQSALAARGRVRLPSRSRWGTFGGAVVLNAMGQPIGELDHLERPAGEPQAVLRIGRWTDVFGIVDLGHAETIRVPAERLVYGSPGAAGPTHVVLATFGTDAASAEASTSGA